MCLGAAEEVIDGQRRCRQETLEENFAEYGALKICFAFFLIMLPKLSHLFNLSVDVLNSQGASAHTQNTQHCRCLLSAYHYWSYIVCYVQNVCIKRVVVVVVVLFFLLLCT